MLGITHAASGRALWAVGCAGIQATTDTTPPPTLFAAGLLIAGWAAYLPDLDHPHSKAARSFGPISGLIAWMVSKAGHRTITHTLPATLLTGALVAGSSRVVAEVLVWGCGILNRVPPATHTLHPSTNWWPWIAFAAMVGYLAHLLGDACTVSGVPLFWPAQNLHSSTHLLPRWLRLHTGHRPELFGVLPTLWVIMACGILWWAATYRSHPAPVWLLAAGVAWSIGISIGTKAEKRAQRTHA